MTAEPTMIIRVVMHTSSVLVVHANCRSLFKPIALAVLAVTFCITAAHGVADEAVKARLAATPPMGWNSWEAFRRDFDEDIIKAEADAMVNSGLRDAGYSYFVIDGGWKPSSRAPDGTLIEDPKKFPHGIKAVIDYVHSKGLKFGLHQPAGMHDCPRLSPGSQGFEERDAALFGQWGVDFIKYDQCDYVHAKDTVPGSPDFDRFVLRQGDKTIFSTEAEAVQNHITGLARVERRAACSGGSCVCGIGYDNAALVMPDISAPAAGKYTLDVYFCYPFFGWNKDQFRSLSFSVTVNDSPRRRIKLPYSKPQRYSVGMTSVDVDLKDGNNTITIDNPNSQEEDVRQSYVKMAHALERTGRPIMFSISGAPRAWLWAAPIAHLYRCEDDVIDRWSGEGHTITWILDRHIPLLDYAQVEFWPDPDMLEVGRKGRIDRPEIRTPAMTDAEYRAQFSLWCIMNAPLFISMDLRQIDDATKKILLNRDVIAVSQDPLASPCQCVRSVGDIQIFTKRLSNGIAVAFLNRGADAADAQISTADLGLASSTLEARDLWSGQTTKIEDGLIKAHMPTHAVILLRIK